MTRIKIQLVVSFLTVTALHALDSSSINDYTTQANFHVPSDSVPPGLPPSQPLLYLQQPPQLYHPVDQFPAYFVDPLQPMVTQPYGNDPLMLKQRKDENPLHDYKQDFSNLKDNLAQLAEHQRAIANSLKTELSQKPPEPLPLVKNKTSSNQEALVEPVGEVKNGHRNNPDTFRYNSYSSPSAYSKPNNYPLPGPSKPNYYSSANSKPNYYSPPAPLYPPNYHTEPYEMHPPSYSHQSHYQHQPYRPHKHSTPQKKKKKTAKKPFKNLKKIMDQRRKEINRLLNPRRGFIRAPPAPNNYEIQQHAQRTFMYIKRGLIDALLTALVVFVVKMLPLVFYGLKLMFQSMIPLAGMAVYHNQRGLFAQRQPNRRLGVFGTRRRGLALQPQQGHMISPQSNVIDDDQVIVEQDEVNSGDEAVDDLDGNENDIEENEDEINDENNDEFDNDNVDVDETSN